MQSQTLEILSIANKWYTLAHECEVPANDTFFRFVAIWISFNALYASMYSDKEGDWNQVRSFAGNPDAIDRHRNLLSKDSVYLESVSVLKDKGVYDLRNRRWRNIRHEHDLTSVASCLYQVRNNLFHASKMPGNPRDKCLVEASYAIVVKLIAPFLDETKHLL